MSPAQSSAPAITLAWVTRLRWGALAGQGVVLAFAVAAVGLPLPLGPLAALLVIAAASNVGLVVWQRRGPSPSSRVLAAVFAFDIAILTALLYFSGGPSNPFSIFYLVQVMLAALVLGMGWAAALVALSALAYAGLFAWHVMIPGMGHLHGGGSSAFSLHLYGMWVAFTVTAGLIAFFGARLASALRTREEQLAAAQRVAARHERLATVSTLAAGAAHELGTPLATIAVVAKELERALAADASAADDARLIRHEVERCREVLTRLGSQAGQSLGEAPETTTADALLVSVREALGRRGAGRLETAGTVDARLTAPLRALVQVLANLVQNGIDALGPQSLASVRVSVAVEARAVSFRVEDGGAGMGSDVLARLGEPFFTTKAPGAGLGLGVFLARSFAEGLGGRLDVASIPGRGTTVTLLVPQAGAR